MPCSQISSSASALNFRLLIAPCMGLFDAQITSNTNHLWRPPLAMLLAAPMVSILRATMLNAVALPLFTLILGGSAALGILIWRITWYLMFRGTVSD